MFNWLNKRKKQQAEEIAKKAEELAEDMAERILEKRKKEKLEKKAEEEAKREEELRLAKIALDEVRAKKKESNEFYLEIVAETVTENGVQIEMDWNDACIEYLKKAGITGPTEEIIVHKYLGAVSRDIQMEEIAHEYTNNQSEELGQVSKYTYDELDDEDDPNE